MLVYGMSIYYYYYYCNIQQAALTPSSSSVSSSARERRMSPLVMSTPTVLWLVSVTCALEGIRSVCGRGAGESLGRGRHGHDAGVAARRLCAGTRAHKARRCSRLWFGRCCGQRTVPRYRPATAAPHKYAAAGLAPGAGAAGPSNAPVQPPLQPPVQPPVQHSTAEAAPRDTGHGRWGGAYSAASSACIAARLAVGTPRMGPHLAATSASTSAGLRPASVASHSRLSSRCSSSASLGGSELSSASRIWVAASIVWGADAAACSASRAWPLISLGSSALTMNLRTSEHVPGSTAQHEGAAVERECDGGPVELDHWIRLGRV